MQNLPNIFIIYPTTSEFTQQLHKLPNNFRIYPTTSEFTQQLQSLPNTFRIYPTPSERTQHLQNLRTPSEFTQHLQNLTTPPLVIFHFSLVTMKVHIKDGNFSTPAFFASDRPLPVYFWSKKLPEPPKPICLAKNKLEGVGLRRKMQGLRISHL